MRKVCQEQLDLFQQLGGDFQDIVQLRHHIHKYPEIGFQEFETQKTIKSHLLKLGVEENQIKIVAKTGFVVDIKGQGDAVPEQQDLINTIAFRADIDALPMTEGNHDLEYRSTTQAAHMCGHDGHIASLLGATQIFMKNIKQIPSNKTIRLLIQPAEEGPGGALPMIKEGCMKTVDECYGYHNLPFDKEGVLIVKSKLVMVGVTTFSITVTGKGGHGSTPHLSNNPIIPICQIASCINQIIPNVVNAQDSIVVSICQISSGETYNVIPDQAKMQGTIRIFDQTSYQKVLENMKKIVENVAESFNCKGELFINPLYKAVVNHEKQSEYAKQVGVELLGEENVTSNYLPIPASEDFSFFIDIESGGVPGAFLFFGTIKDDNRYSQMCHKTDYDFNDDIIPVVSNYWVKLAESRLGFKIQ